MKSNPYDSRSMMMISWSYTSVMISIAVAAAGPGVDDRGAYAVY
jgi:hypothetical protein